jgi:hypothetical protein
VKRFPEEFSRILSARGRRVLAGKDPLCGAMRRGNFLAASDLLDRTKAPAVTRLLGKTFGRAMPFWHYTTPLQVHPRRTSARRWLVLGSFFRPGRSQRRGS